MMAITFGEMEDTVRRPVRGQRRQDRLLPELVQDEPPRAAPRAHVRRRPRSRTRRTASPARCTATRATNTSDPSSVRVDPTGRGGSLGEFEGAAEAGAVRCALVGDEPLVAQCADVARAHGLEVVLIATTNPLVRDYAVEQGIAVVGPGAELAAGLDSHPADVLLSIANLRMIPDDVLGPRVDGDQLPRRPAARVRRAQRHDVGDPRRRARARHHVAPDDVRRRRRRDRRHRALPDRRRRDRVLAQRPLLRGGAGDLPAHRRGARRRRRARPSRSPPASTACSCATTARRGCSIPASRPTESARAVRALDLGHRLRNSIGVGAPRARRRRRTSSTPPTPTPTPSGAAPGTVVAARRRRRPHRHGRRRPRRSPR